MLQAAVSFREEADRGPAFRTGNGAVQAIGIAIVYFCDQNVRVIEICGRKISHPVSKGKQGINSAGYGIRQDYRTGTQAMD